MNILVTSVSRKVPLLAALRGALDRLAPDGLVWGADADPECVGRHFADRFWEMPPVQGPDGPDQLREFCAREKIGLIVPTRDGELPHLAALRGELGAHASIGTTDAVAVCLDKLDFYFHCEREKVPTIPTATSLDALEGDRFVVKERHGAGSRAMRVGLDRKAALAHAELLEEPIFQPLAAGIEHSVDVYVNLAGQVVDAAPRERVRVHDGESVITKTVEHPQLVREAARLAESLDLRGHVVIQAFANDDCVSVLECNPRVGGASTCGFAAGVDSPSWWIQEARGEAVEPRLGSYRRGIRLVRYPKDRLIEP